MGPGWKLTDAELAMLADVRSDQAAVIEQGGQLVRPGAEHAARRMEEWIDEHQTKDFYHGMASALKLWANNLRHMPGPAAGRATMMLHKRSSWRHSRDAPRSGKTPPGSAIDRGTRGTGLRSPAAASEGDTEALAVTDPNDYAEPGPPSELPSLGYLAALIGVAILAILTVAVAWSRYH
jgi:hypothetical protein